MRQNMQHNSEDWTDRQKDVLNAALHLLVEGKDAPTMADIARRASCSKESIYKWFGDRDRFLEAMVRWQASQVRLVPLSRERIDFAALFSSLENFAGNWLLVLSGSTSIALNRLAIGQGRLGAIVLHNGLFAMAKRLQPLLELGREAGLLAFDDFNAVFRSFFGLVVGDLQIRLLLGDNPVLGAADIARQAHAATQQFFTLYGVKGDKL
ncbi:MAG: DNA-binding transcriptional regulator AcrR family [Candidatus Tokpelaia hoelldobleri]|uniref:DNA-binding transcriptional regulator AcrR family n=1 Tax=Candidatus Tokpelaia hoelldobleri TaxID=1902579 RepID=A0A1U9JVR7_9HYPH|nr:MAG: DNA-binding transcriptional regulator AcrR family [Candidatus Tokpelaia hoelldoblerii]